MIDPPNERSSYADAIGPAPGVWFFLGPALVALAVVSLAGYGVYRLLR